MLHLYRLVLTAVSAASWLATALHSTTQPAPSAAAQRVPVDHLIIAIDSLDRGIALLRDATGVTPVVGGVHPGRGTQNALMSLGRGQYLELLAPNPADTAGPRATRDMAQFRALTPVGWAARTTNADSLNAALRARGLVAGVVRPGSRARPDGRTMRWRTVSPWATYDPLLPFFIEWAADTPHPSTESPGGCTLVEMTLASPRADSLRADLARAGLQVPVTQAAAPAITVVLDCPRGRVTLPAAR